MNERSKEENQQIPSIRMIAASAYSARIQEVMRYDKLSPSDYDIVMSIMRAVSQGYTEEKWKSEQQRKIKFLLEQPTNQKIAHAESANRYEQTITGLKGLVLWPW